MGKRSTVVEQRNRKLANCPNVAEHVKGEPDGYNAWHDWAQRMGKTHTQLKCDGCGLYAIWKPAALNPGDTQQPGQAPLAEPISSRCLPK